MRSIGQYKVILSDLDGVLRSYPIQHSESIESEFGLPHGSLLSLAFQKNFLEAVVVGQITDESWRSEIVNEVENLIPRNRAEAAVLKWSEFPGKLESQVLNLYKAKKSKCKIALLTNATTKLNKDLRTLGIIDFFDAIFNTSEIGFAKPDKRAFQYAISKLQCDASEIFFVDDQLKNIEVAKSLKMGTHHFIEATGLELALSW